MDDAAAIQLCKADTQKRPATEKSGIPIIFSQGLQTSAQGDMLAMPLRNQSKSLSIYQKILIFPGYRDV
jgi:hypothetical protein